ncbi:7TMR-DISM family protein [Halarcobacter bivalviorum]|uniref:7TMR-DISM family protein n=1 Tax=Halarcobacter bivalviorum TaxID=663364 RepID=UPI00100A460D|nr:7TM diverse intracellular signaling domain-containing protein [Halarcobacter bivalviorum]RXK06168.1 hypothetical protein CRU97_06510 [Halarcobacter bivalviorum]
MQNSKNFFIEKLLFLVFLFFISFAQATINSYEVYYYNDPSSTLSLKDIENKEFEKINKNFSLGYKKGNSWLKIKFYNNQPSNKFFVELNEFFYDKVTFYEQVFGTWLEKNYQLNKKLSYRDIPTVNPVFSFSANKNSNKIFYIKFKSKYSHFGKMNIYPRNYYLLGLKNYDYLHLFTIISLLIAFIISTIIYYRQKEKIYIYYMLYTLFLAVYIFKMSSFIVYVNLQEYIYQFHFITGIAVGFFILFSKEILEVKKYLKKIAIIIDISAILMFLISFMILIEYNPWNILLNTLITFIFILLLFTSFYTYKKGNTNSKYYFLVVFLYFIAAILFTLMLAGILEYNILTRYGYLFIITLEIVAFTLLLINKYNKVHPKEKLFS